MFLILVMAQENFVIIDASREILHCSNILFFKQQEEITVRIWGHSPKFFELKFFLDQKCFGLNLFGPNSFLPKMFWA